MSDQSALRDLARKAMQAGTLPNRPPDRVWGGPGGNAGCAVCGKAIERQETEFELQYTEHADQAKTYHAHVHCFAAWELERQSAGADRALPDQGYNGIISVCEHNAKNGGER